jgi:hypothetical protein
MSPQVRWYLHDNIGSVRDIVVDTLVDTIQYNTFGDLALCSTG